MKTLLISSLALAAAVISSFAASVDVAWDPSPDADVTGYRLQVGTAAGVHSTSIDLEKVTEGTVPNLIPGTQYFIIVRAVNGAGLVSEPSNEITVKIPRPATNLRPVVVKTPTATGMRLDITGDPAKRLVLMRKGGAGNWKKLETIKNFSGEFTYLDKEWKPGKNFEWKVEVDKA